MSSTTGKSWAIGTYVDSTPANLGGIPFDVKITKKATVTKESGTGQRKLASIDTSGIYWVIDFKLKVQVLATFINAKCMITAEGALPSFNLYTDDGTTKRGFTGCYVNTCQIDVGQTGAMTASIQVIALANEDKTLTITQATEAPMTKASVTAPVINGVTITAWQKISFGVNNNVEVVATGNGAAMTEIFAKQAEYSGSIQLVKKASMIFAYSTDVNGDLVLAFVDNQSSPITKTYTFDEVGMASNDYSVRELDVTIESVSWEGDELTIA